MNYYNLGLFYHISLAILMIAMVLLLIYKSYTSKNTFSKWNVCFLVPLFAILYAMYFTANKYIGEEVNAFILFSFLNDVIEVVKFKIPVALVSNISKEIPIYYSSFIMAYAAITFATIISVASIFGQRLTNYFRKKILLHKNCDIVVGDSETSYNYMKKNDNCILLGTEMSKTRYTDLIKEGILVIKVPLNAKKLKRYLKNKKYNIIVFRDSKHSYSSIINTFDNAKALLTPKLPVIFSKISNYFADKKQKKVSNTEEKEAVNTEITTTENKENNEKNNSFIKVLKEKIKAYKEQKCAEKDLSVVKFQIYLEANQRELKILKDKISNTQKDNVNIYGFSKYELLARTFVVEHPISRYLPEDFVNDNLTIKNDKDINIVFIGFGKMNYQLFRMCTTQFQFAKQENNSNKLSAKLVNYHIFDKDSSNLHNEIFSKINYEFDKKFADTPDEYFAPPERICNIIPHKIDINSIRAKKLFESYVNENSYTYFIISLSNDLEDASYAQTLKRILPNHNYKIFVRAKNEAEEKLNELDDNIIYFGDEKNLYTHANIVNNDLTDLAKKMNFIYNKLNDIRDENIKKEKVGQSGIVNENKDSKLLVAIKKLFHIKTTKEIVDEYMNNSNAKRLEFYAKKKNSIALTNYIDNMWYNLQAIEQTSNLYRALNLPFKLYLLGFTMVKNNKNSKCNGINESYYNHIYKGDKKLDYNNNKFFTETQKSNVLAFMEHSRWNALYIIYDFTRMSIKTITNNGQKELARLKDLNYNATEKDLQTRVAHKDLAQKTHACLTTYYELENMIKYKYDYLDKLNFNDLDINKFKDIIDNFSKVLIKTFTKNQLVGLINLDISTLGEMTKEQLEETIKEKIAGFQEEDLKTFINDCIKKFKEKEISQIYLYDYLDLDYIYEAINSIGYSICCKNCIKID